MSCGMEAKVAVYAALFGDFLQVGIEARVMQHREQFPIRCHSFILFYNGDGKIPVNAEKRNMSRVKFRLGISNVVVINFSSSSRVR